MPEFEDFPAAGEAPSAQKQIKPPTESGPSDRRPEPSSNPPMAPHRGQSHRILPSKDGRRAHRFKRRSSEKSPEYCERGIPPSQTQYSDTQRLYETNPACKYCKYAKGTKGPGLLSRLKNFLLRLLKILRKKRQVPRGEPEGEGKWVGPVPPRRGPPGRRGRASNQANRRGSGGRRRGGSEGREGGSSQRTRNSPTGRDSQRGCAKGWKWSGFQKYR